METFRHVKVQMAKCRKREPKAHQAVRSTQGKNNKGYKKKERKI